MRSNLSRILDSFWGIAVVMVTTALSMLVLESYGMYGVLALAVLIVPILIVLLERPSDK